MAWMGLGFFSFVDFFFTGFEDHTSPQGPQHKVALFLPNYFCLVEHMKRPKDNEAGDCGITVTMGGKPNGRRARGSLGTRYTVEPHAKRPPRVTSRTTKRDSGLKTSAAPCGDHRKSASCDSGPLQPHHMRPFSPKMTCICM